MASILEASINMTSTSPFTPLVSPPPSSTVNPVGDQSDYGTRQQTRAIQSTAADYERRASQLERGPGACNGEFYVANAWIQSRFPGLNGQSKIIVHFTELGQDGTFMERSVRYPMEEVVDDHFIPTHTTRFRLIQVGANSKLVIPTRVNMRIEWPIETVGTPEPVDEARPLWMAGPLKQDMHWHVDSRLVAYFKTHGLSPDMPLLAKYMQRDETGPAYEKKRTWT